MMLRKKTNASLIMSNIYDNEYVEFMDNDDDEIAPEIIKMMEAYIEEQQQSYNAIKAKINYTKYIMVRNITAFICIIGIVLSLITFSL